MHCKCRAGAEINSPGAENHDPQLAEASRASHKDSHCEYGIVDEHGPITAAKGPPPSLNGFEDAQPGQHAALDALDDSYHDALEAMTNGSVAGANDTSTLQSMLYMLERFTILKLGQNACI